MSTEHSRPLESEATDCGIDALDERDARALTEYMTALEDVAEARDAPGVYRVVGQHGATYTVDVRTGACTCQDATYNQPADGCKHRRRVLFATGERAIPAWADRDAVDDQLGEHVDGSPRCAATDGGVVTGDDSSEDTDNQPDSARAVPPREHTRGFWTDERFDDRFRDDPPVRSEVSDR